MVGRSDYSSSDEVVGDPVVMMLLRSRGDAGDVIDREAEAAVGGVEEEGRAP